MSLYHIMTNTNMKYHIMTNTNRKLLTLTSVKYYQKSTLSVNHDNDYLISSFQSVFYEAGHESEAISGWSL